MNSPAPLTPSWQALTTQPDGLSESPFWHPLEQRLYWVDIPGRRLARLKVQHLTQAQGAIEYWPVPEEPGCMAPVAGGGVIVALRDGIYLGRNWGGALELLVAAPYDTARMRFNDGKCDAQGQFWAGTLYEPRDQAAGVLYRLQGQVLHTVADQATVANGLGWSPDGQTLYWSDTASHRIRAWDWDPVQGALSRERVFHQADLKPQGWVWSENPSGSGTRYGGRPDGASVDAQGNYYSAMYEGRRIVKFSPQGEVLEQIETPVQCPTMPCFGGEDLKTLFITTSRNGRSEQELAALPLSGCIFALRVQVPGLPVNFYQL